VNHHSVAVTIVTYNSSRFIRRCFQYLFAQDYPRVEVIVADNASTDDTPKILREFENRVRIVYNSSNTGFAAAQNQAIALSDSDWVLTLNPDVRLTPEFISMMVAAGESDGVIGSVSGKLCAMPANFEVPAQHVLDSTGIYFTPSLRHFDRGSKQPDDGSYERFEYVFGVTGAAALYRRRMIQDISIGGEFFDSDFFAYREDADVAWRAQLLGWKCIYTPRAIAYHVRTALPSNRGSLSSAINMHSVKNRFLMRIKNISPGLYLGHFFAIMFRDLIVVAGCVLREFSSLPAFAFVIRNLRRTWAKRREVMRRRRASDEYVNAWFSSTPVSLPAPEVAARFEIASR
jgi:GT2 family glycosyltransferase